ncbi:MAG: HAD family hydrolase [Oscillospiraceae bacterium]
MKGLAIFDLDGTLINSIEDLASSMNQALSECGLPVHELFKYYTFVGDGAAKLITRAIPEDKLSDNTIKKVREGFIRHYSENYLDKTFIYDGAAELLERLKAKGYMLAVASNKPDEFTSVIIERLFKSGSFDFVRGNILGTPHKPDPQIVFDIIKELEAEKESCIFIGDSGVDVQTAHNAGIKAIGCLWGYRDRAELENAKADYLAGHPLDILKFL